jgi:large exoprotein involved in heme utilization and adhesion
VIFGPAARLDVPGAFHVSTADELRFSDGAVFSASNPAGSSFTVAAPEAFGFLGNTPGSIQVNQSQLRLEDGRTLSLVGGDITLDGGGERPKEDRGIGAENGTVNLVSAAGPGTVRIADAVSRVSRGGEIRAVQHVEPGSLGSFQNYAVVDVSGSDASGAIRIRAGGLSVDRAQIFADNFGARNATGGIDIQADRVSVVAGRITTDVLGFGSGGAIQLAVTDLQVLDGGRIGTDVGTFDIPAGGNAGDVIINADTIRVRGGVLDDKPLASFISSSANNGSGNGGNVAIKARVIELQGATSITAQTNGTGNGGFVNVEADRLILTGDGTNDGAAFLGASAFGFEDASAGNAGNVNIVARELILQDVGQIRSDGFQTSNGGAIVIVTEQLTAGSSFQESSVITTSTQLGKAGNIDITANKIDLKGRARISSTSAGNEDAGNIIISVSDTLALSNDSKISTQSASRDGGNIILSVGKLLDMQDSSLLTSVPDGSGNGGNINIDSSKSIENGRVLSIALQNSRIVADASGGDGGNITILAGQLIRTPGSRISASSKTGVSGEIDISAPITDIAASLIALPAGFISTSSPLPSACASRGGQARSSLTGAGRGSSPPDPGSSLASPSKGRERGKASLSQSKVEQAGLLVFNTAADPTKNGCRNRRAPRSADE